jgi:glycosyltransferase involved in cell wall biosynthesis
MTKILRIIADSNPSSGGPIEGTRRFGEVWAAHGHRQDMLTLDAPGETWLTDYPGKIIALGTQRTSNPVSKYRYSPRMVPWLCQHARDYDAILVSGLWRYQARGAGRALAGGATPYFVLPHGMLDPWFRETYPLKHIVKQLSWWWAEGPLLANARAVLFTSEEEKRLAEGIFRPWKANSVVIGYGTQDVIGDSESQKRTFRAAVPALGKRDYLLFLSRIHPKKGCDILVEAFAAIAAEAPHLDLVIAGPDQVGLANTLREQAERLNISDRLHFPGMLKGDVKTGAFRGATAFVLPSHQENFGIVVAEALACATPVLISNKVNIWREVEADGAGLIEPDTIEGTTALLTAYLAMNTDAHAEMRKRARSCFLNRFHAEKAAMDLLALIQQ